jgi:hypothetical protein
VRRFIAALIAASACSFGASASAYTLHTAERGQNVRWNSPRVDVIVDTSFLSLSADALQIAAASFAAWRGPDASLPEVALHEGTADGVGYLPGGFNLSTIRFEPEGSDLAVGALGATLTTYDADGNLIDADIILNGGPDRPFAVLPALDIFPDPVHYDIQNVLTHEVGHFFGFGEEPDLPDATMFPTSGRGETHKRDLSADDSEGVSLLYAPAEGEAVQTGCSLGAARTGALPHAVIGTLVALTLLLGRLRRAGEARVRRFAFAGALAALATPAVGASGPASAGDAGPAAFAEVVSSEARWIDGVIVTRLGLDVTSDGDTAPATIEVYGGTKGGLTQLLDGLGAPAVGSTFPLAREGSALRLPSSLPRRLGAVSHLASHPGRGVSRP